MVIVFVLGKHGGMTGTEGYSLSNYLKVVRAEWRLRASKV